MNEMQILEKLFELVGQAGEGAFTLGVIYLLKYYFISIIVLSFLIFLTHKVSKIITTNVASARAIIEIASVLGIAKNQYTDRFGDCNYDIVLEKMVELKNSLKK